MASLFARTTIGAAAIAVGIVGACRGPTEVWVEISTDIRCSDLGGTTITVGRLGEIEAKPPTAVTPRCAPDGRIGALVVVPSGETDELVAVKVVTGMGRAAESCTAPEYGRGCIVARRALRFVPASSLRLPVFMAAVCDGVPCEATQTCVKGTCETATIDDSSRCVDSGCAEDELFAPRDAGGAGSDGSTPSNDAGVDGPSTAKDAGATCPTGRGPTMVRVNAGGAQFCVDSTEVLEQDYAAFRTQGGGVGLMPPACAFKTELSAAGTGGPLLPVAWIDWCDAYAFCSFAGKRLCTMSEWKRACTGGTSNAYPYGPTFDASACNDTEGAIAAAKAFPACVGGVPGLYDMSGNVDEWTSDCQADAGPRGSCTTMGGDFNDVEAAVTCNGSATISARDYTSRVRGMRCCAD